jgi:HlyD family secretion protein
MKENQAVKKGDVVAYIDDSQLQTQKSQLQGNIQQSQLQLVQIEAQINALNSQIVAETGAINRAIALNQADLSRNQREYKDRLITTQAEVQEAEAELQKTLAGLPKAQADLESAKKYSDIYRQLKEKGAVSREKFDEKELAVKSQKLAVEAQEQTIKVAAARVQRVKTALNPSAASVTMATQRIAQEKDRGEATIAALNKEQAALVQRQIEIQNQINRDRKELQQVETELAKTVIHSPSDGIVLELNLRNAGQSVTPKDAIAQIAPSDAPLIVKARVATQDRGKVEIDQKVKMRIAAYSYPDYGILEGKVKAIAPDAITPQNSGAGAAATYYEVTIQPEKPYLKDNPQNAIQSGMEVTADIISREETVLKFILRKARLLTDL